MRDRKPDRPALPGTHTGTGMDFDFGGGPARDQSPSDEIAIPCAGSTKTASGKSQLHK